MRIALLSDIHGNLIALEAVLQELVAELGQQGVNIARASRHEPH